MRNLFAATAVAALITSPAHATYQELTPIPEIEVGGGGDAAAILLLLGIGAIILWQSLDDEQPTANCPTLSDPDALTGGKGDALMEAPAC
jgi:hypothetical protein